jgi:hypothetical protein
MKKLCWPCLDLPFVMVFSQALGETIFFCQDEYIKEALVEGGVGPWGIYTRSELQILVRKTVLRPPLMTS